MRNFVLYSQLVLIIMAGVAAFIAVHADHLDTRWAFTSFMLLLLVMVRK